MDIQNDNVVPADTQGQAPKKSTNLILVILVIILLLGNAVVLYFLFKKPTSQPENNIVTKNENINNNSTSTESGSEFEININWQGSAAKASNEDVFDASKLETRLSTLSRNDVYFKNVKELFSLIIPYFVGTVSGGNYDGAKVYIVELQEMGLPLFYTMKVNDRIILLQNYSDELYSGIDFLFDEKSNVVIKNLNIPKVVKINDKYNFVLINEKPYRLSSNLSTPADLTPVITENEFTIYKDNYGCYISNKPDGAARKYYFNLPFLGGNALTITEPDYRKPYILDITWLDGKKNTDEYYIESTYMMSSGGTCVATASYIKDVSQLRVIGKTNNGEDIYVLKDSSTKRSVSDQESILQSIYDEYYPGENIKKISFANFLASKPLIFWRDPLGYFVVMRNFDYAPMAEMGKPVIYLYPTKTADVSVKVNPTGGFIKTEPVYGNGWQVKAEPNGNLYNYQDKKNYPYLFWEGYALNYQISNEGFVVAKNEVNKFLREKLAIQGLNAKEINDFMEFWLARMQSDPYYFVTFLPQAEFDKMAPLTVSPRPDSVIRVFMDFRALAKPIQVKEQKLTTPKRMGFTVVEWGGELQK
jgi:hypothetical protein